MLRETSNSPRHSGAIPHSAVTNVPLSVHQCWNGNCGREGVLRTVACFALICLVSCVSLGNKPVRADVKPWPEIRPDFRVEALRLRMHEYAITFAAEVDLAATAIEARTADSAVRRNALLWRVRAIPEMRKACFRMEPVAALVDAWIFARQMDQLFTDGGGAAAFGGFQPEAIDVSRRLVQQLREIGGSIAASPDARDTFEHRIVDSWAVLHPLRDLTFVRDSPIAPLADQSRAGGDVFQSVSTMEELAVTLSQQVRIYLADLPRQVRGEFDLMRTDILPADGMASLQKNLDMSAGAADRLASTAESIAPMVLSERRIVLEEVSRQRALVIDALSFEREQAIGALATQGVDRDGEVSAQFRHCLMTLGRRPLERGQPLHLGALQQLTALRGKCPDQRADGLLPLEGKSLDHQLPLPAHFLEHDSPLAQHQRRDGFRG